MVVEFRPSRINLDRHPRNAVVADDTKRSTRAHTAHSSSVFIYCADGAMVSGVVVRKPQKKMISPEATLLIIIIMLAPILRY